MISSEAKWILIVTTAIGLLAIGVYLWFSTADTHEVEVTAQEAFYEVPVEDYQPRKAGGWDETVPSDAYDKTSYSKQRGSHQQFSGQTCVKIGKTNSCTNNYITIPDYDTWVDYTVDRWQVIRTATAAYHSSKDALICPDPDVKEDAVIKYGSQRAQPCIKHYSVTLKDADRAYSCDVNSDVWFALPAGTVLHLKVGRFTQTPWCDTISA